MLKPFLFSRYFNCYLDFFGHVGEKLSKVNFKIYGVTQTNNCNTHIASYFKK